MLVNNQNFDRTQTVGKTPRRGSGRVRKKRVLRGDESQTRFGVPGGARGRKRSSSDQSRADQSKSSLKSNPQPEVRRRLVSNPGLLWPRRALSRSKSLVPVNQASRTIHPGFPIQARVNDLAYNPNSKGIPWDGLHSHHQ